MRREYKQETNIQIQTGNIKHGADKRYTGEDIIYYPNLAKYESNIKVDETIAEDKIGESDDGTGLDDIHIPLEESDTNSKKQATTQLIVKQTYYNVNQKKELYEDANFYNLIFGGTTAYWIASRYSLCGSVNAYFGLRIVEASTLKGEHLFYSTERNEAKNSRVSPVISLKSNIRYKNDGNKSWNILNSN